MEPEKSSYMHLFELNAKKPHKLTLSCSSPNRTETRDGVFHRPPIDYQTKVRSWLIHEDQNLTPTSIPPSPPPSVYPPESTKKKKENPNKKNIDTVKMENPVRHSSRKRIKPIEFWNNETIIYDDDGTLIAVENSILCSESKRYKGNEKNKNEGEKWDQENSIFKLPLISNNNVKRKEKNAIERTKNKKVAQTQSKTKSQDKRNIKEIKEKSNKRRFVKDKTENEKPDSTVASEMNNEVKISQNIKKRKLETLPLPSTDSEAGLRRGKRNRIAPVAFWDNDFVQYDDDGNLVGIEHLGAKDLEDTVKKSEEKVKKTEEKGKKMHPKANDEIISVTSSDALSNSENWKKAKKKKKLSTTDLAIKNIRKSRKRKKSMKNNLSEYPFSQLNKESSFTLGRILEITDKTGTVRKLTPFKEANANGVNAAHHNSPIKEAKINRVNATHHDSPINEANANRNLQEITNNDVNENDVQERPSKGAALDIGSSSALTVTRRQSRRSRIAPVEFWNSQYIQYNADGTLVGVEDWTKKTTVNTPVKESCQNEDGKEAKKFPISKGPRDLEFGPKKLFSPDLNVLQEAATVNDTSSSLSRRRLFEPIAPSNKNSRVISTSEETDSTADATFAVQIHSTRKRDQSTQKALIIGGITELPLTPITEESPTIIDFTKSSAPRSQKRNSKSPIMTWLSKKTLNSLVTDKSSGGYAKDPNENGLNNCNREVTPNGVAGSNVIEAEELITDFGTPFECLEDAEDIRLAQTSRQVMAPKDNLGNVLTHSPQTHSLTPYQIMQKEIEEFQLNASLKSPVINDNLKTTISFLPQKLNHINFNAAWATPATKKSSSNFEDKRQKVSKVPVENENHSPKRSNLRSKSKHTKRCEENSPLLETMQKISNVQNLRSAEIILQKEAANLHCDTGNLPASTNNKFVDPLSESSGSGAGTDYGLCDGSQLQSAAQQKAEEHNPPTNGQNVSIDTDPSAKGPNLKNGDIGDILDKSIAPNVNNEAILDKVNKAVVHSENSSVTESLEAYVKNSVECRNRDPQSVASQDEPEYSCEGSHNTTTGFEKKEKHEFYPIIDTETGDIVCHMAQSVAHKDSGIFTSFISIHEGKGTQSWEVTDEAVVFVLEGIGTLRRTLGKKVTQTYLKPNDVVNITKGERVALKYSERRSDGPLTVMFILGGSSVAWSELEEALEQLD